MTQGEWHTLDEFGGKLTVASFYMHLSGVTTVGQGGALASPLSVPLARPPHPAFCPAIALTTAKNSSILFYSPLLSNEP